MSACERKEHHTDATETVNNLCNKLRQRRLQLLNTDDWYLLTQTLIWKISKPSLIIRKKEKISAQMKLLQELVPDCDKCVGRSILTGKLQA
ncbi:hypothetical protein DY000_02061107 [Brassica cretica]|uniref:Uncharacterized protein n=1 Tax=Brassica cretica TaxID=69181 RepID=A0ABQ7AQ15_BRACR|nr:hypothetical protein DY000_02061107 [Brassica cretica]